MYGNLPSAAVVVTPDSAYDTTTDRRTSETECSSKSISKNRGEYRMVFVPKSNKPISSGLFFFSIISNELTNG